MKKAFLTILISLVCLLMMRPAGAQTLKYSQQALQFERTKEINVSSIRTDWFVSFRNLEKPLVGNNGYKRMLEAAKLEISRRYPRRTDRYSPSYTNFTTDTPIVHRNFEGNVFSNSVPNDNTMAISNSGKLVSAINTNIRFYDIALDSLEATISLTAFSDTLQLNNSQYDPKLIYDPSEDRFIIVYLAGNKDSTSNIIVGFSTSPDPTQTWNLYYLPGNPLNDTSWSDYPAIGLTGDELFITMNLLENEGEWQTAFKQSVIWQVNKFDGYAGTTLNTLLWTDIVFGGTNIRNMHPVRGGSQLYGPDMYFLSNKNFAIQSDSIFMIHIDGNISGTPQLTVDLLHSDVAYGMPPVARQTGIHTLETNDARMLGAFIENSNIQFVFNCVDTTTGFAGFYHGVISDVGGANTVSGNIISDTLLDFGYPNIAYCGDGAGDNRSVITFNHSGTAEYPGFSAMYYNGSGVFSKYTMIARGNTYINVLSGAYERWGDYSGIQRKYNETGIIWASGTFGKKVMDGPFTSRLNGTWIAEIERPATTGIAEKKEASTTRVFPVPAKEFVQVELTLAKPENIRASLYDMTGNLVITLLETSAGQGKNSFVFSTNPLSSGNYLLLITDDSGKHIHEQKISVIR